MIPGGLQRKPRPDMCATSRLPLTLTAMAIAIEMAFVFAAPVFAQDQTPQPSDSAQAARAESPPQPVQLDGCLVSLIDVVRHSPPVPGTLSELYVKPGDLVQTGQPLAKLDDRSAAAAQRVAEARLREAAVAASDVDIRDARTAARLAEQALTAARQATSKSRGAVAGNEMRRLENDAQRTTLSIERSERDFERAQQTLEVRSAELDAANLQLQRHTLTSTMRGRIVDVYRHAGEWLAGGEPLIHIVQLDRLRIEAFVDPALVGPQEITGRRVVVSAPLERGRVENFTGHVTFVRDLIDTNGQYRIQAEVTNRRENGHWLLRPGLLVSMSVSSTASDSPPAEPLVRRTPVGAVPDQSRLRVTTGQWPSIQRTEPLRWFQRRPPSSGNGVWRPAANSLR